jgi:hypothetical protein
MTEEARMIQRMQPRLQRILVVDQAPASARMLSDLMRNISPGQSWAAGTNAKAMMACNHVDPQLIFVELSSQDVDGIGFTRELRRSTLPCRQAPVIMVTATATAGAIMAARDAGVHEFLRKPYNTRDLLKRLEAVILRPRDWVEAVQYIGPDRRRFNSGDYKGKLKRKADNEAKTDASRIIQALRILKSALTAIEADPSQALRSMQAQVLELQRVAVTVSDPQLLAAVGEFQTYLANATEGGVMISAEALRQAQSLLAFLPPDEPRAGKAA